MAERKEGPGEEQTREQTGGQTESGQPGGGVGRREDVRGSGVYPASGAEAPEDAETRTPGEWGKGAGGEGGGRSELRFTDEELRGADEDGEAGSGT
jgi:hypothetical protein